MCLERARLNASSRRISVLHLALETRRIGGGADLPTALRCHHDRLNLKLIKLLFDVCDPFRNILLSPGPLILILESRLYINWVLLSRTLLNNVERSVSLTRQIHQGCVLELGLFFIWSLGATLAVSESFLND